MTFEQIQYFLELGKTLSFTVASNNLYVAQPSLSKQIRKLEDELGVQLVKRTTKKVELTQAGQTFYSEFSYIMKSIENAVLEVRQAGKKIINLAVFQPARNLPELGFILNKISRLLPEYEVHMLLQRHRELMETYQNHSADMFFVPDEYLPYMVDSKVRPLAQIHSTIIYSERLISKSICSVKELTGRTLLLLEQQYQIDAEEKILRWLEENGCVPSNVRRTGDIINTIRFVDPEGCFTIVHEYKQDNIPDDLFFYYIEDPSMNSNINLIIPKGTDAEIESIIYSLEE